MSVKHMLKQNQDIYGFICIDRTIMTVLGNIYPRAYNLQYRQLVTQITSFWKMQKRRGIFSNKNDALLYMGFPDWSK
jgi:hypothetical protein